MEPVSSFFVIEIIFSALKICFDSKSTMSLLLALLSSKRLSVFEKWLPIHSLATSRSQSSSRRAVGAGDARSAGGAMAPEYDQSRIFDIRPKPKFSFKKIRPSAEGISQSRRYEVSFSSPSSEVHQIRYPRFL